MKVIVGLGNPGPKYAKTRHNVGFAVADEVARILGVASWHRGFASKVAEAPGAIIVKPQTYMNLSGDAVYQICRYMGVSASDFLVILDDMDLDLGRIRLRPKGGSGGHRGMQSIVERMGTNEIPRIRVGIGRPPAGEDPVSFVLKKPSPAERDLLERAILLAAEAALCFIQKGLSHAMNLYNSPPGSEATS